MNIAVLNLKDMLKYTIKIFATMLLLFLISNYILKREKSLSNIFPININSKFLKTCLNITIPEFNNNKEAYSIKVTDLMRIETAILTNNVIEEKIVDIRHRKNTNRRNTNRRNYNNTNERNTTN